MVVFKSRREILSKLSLGLVSIPFFSTGVLSTLDSSSEQPEPLRGYACKITTNLPMAVDTESVVSSVFKQWYDTVKMDQLVEEYMSTNRLLKADFSFHGSHTNWVVTFDAEPTYRRWVQEIADRNIVNVEEQLRQGVSVTHTPLLNS